MMLITTTIISFIMHVTDKWLYMLVEPGPAITVTSAGFSQNAVEIYEGQVRLTAPLLAKRFNSCPESYWKVTSFYFLF